MHSWRHGIKTRALVTTDTGNMSSKRAPLSDSYHVGEAQQGSFRQKSRYCRLTEDAVIEIFQCKGGPSNASKTARAFAVSEKTVRDIWTGRTWAKETQHLDASRTIKVTQMGRPKGRRDTRPRKSRRIHASDSAGGVTLSQQQGAAENRPGIFGLKSKGGRMAESADRRCNSGLQQSSSLDSQLYVWEQQHDEAPAFHDPFDGELARLLWFLSSKADPWHHQEIHVGWTLRQ